MSVSQSAVRTVLSTLRRSRHQPSLRRIYFLMVTVDGGSGVPRTVSMMANALAEQHDVEIISVYRRRDEPNFPVDPRVRLTYLYDQRRDDEDGQPVEGVRRARAVPGRSRAQAWLDSKPSAFVPEEAELSRLSDLLLLRALRGLRPGVLISVRPALHVAAARLAPSHMITIAQDHLNYPTRMSRPHVVDVMSTVTSDLDCLAALTQADVADYRARFPDARALITSVPNAASWVPVSQPSVLDQKVVVSVGRLERRKGFHRLIAAYEPVARKHPDWQLHIYGQGEQGGALAALIARRKLGEQVIMKGFASDLEDRLTSTSIYAMASIYEGWPMVLMEAMSRGLPLVSYDCPRGPGEIIVDGSNGRLVPDGDEAALTDALLQVIEDPGLRRRMGRQALDDVGAYSIDAVAQRWERLFEQLLRRRAEGSVGYG